MGRTTCREPTPSVSATSDHRGSQAPPKKAHGEKRGRRDGNGSPETHHQKGILPSHTVRGPTAKFLVPQTGAHEKWKEGGSLWSDPTMKTEEQFSLQKVSEGRGRGRGQVKVAPKVQKHQWPSVCIWWRECTPLHRKGLWPEATIGHQNKPTPLKNKVGSVNRTIGATIRKYCQPKRDSTRFLDTPPL